MFYRLKHFGAKLMMNLTSQLWMTFHMPQYSVLHISTVSFVARGIQKSLEQFQYGVCVWHAGLWTQGVSSHTPAEGRRQQPTQLKIFQLWKHMCTVKGTRHVSFHEKYWAIAIASWNHSFQFPCTGTIDVHVISIFMQPITSHFGNLIHAYYPACYWNSIFLWN